MTIDKHARTARRVVLAIISMYAGIAAYATAGAAASAGGVYALAAPGVPVPPAVLTNPYVDGIALRYYWDALEPRQGVFNWAEVDRAIGQAQSSGKKVSLSAAAGVHTPPWVFSDGAPAFSFLWDKPWGPPRCSQLKIPVPWNPAYLAKWQAFVREFGRRYDRKRAVVQVKLTGINGTSQEISLPHPASARATPRRAQCPGENYVEQWEQLGYSPIKVRQAWKVMLETFAQSFPNQKLALIIVPNGFPAVGAAQPGGRRARGDAQLQRDLVVQSTAALGSQLILQNNGLSASWNWKPSPLQPAALGYQMLWNVTNDRSCRMNHGMMPCDPHSVFETAVNRGIEAGASFLEIYIADLENPRLQDVLSSAHTRLASR